MTAVNNAFEHAARLQKIQKLTAVLDIYLRLAGVNPYSEQALVAISNLSEQGWVAAAVKAKCKAPSEQTRSEIVAIYRARPAHVAQVRKGARL